MSQGDLLGGLAAQHNEMIETLHAQRAGVLAERANIDAAMQSLRSYADDLTAHLLNAYDSQLHRIDGFLHRLGAGMPDPVAIATPPENRAALEGLNGHRRLAVVSQS